MSSQHQSSKKVKGIYWFRKCLRLHDNPALTKASNDCDLVYPIFIIDPWFQEKGKVGINRWRFLWDSLRDLDESLKKLNSGLIILIGNPKEVINMKLKEWNITDFYYEYDSETYSQIRDNEVNELIKESSICLHIEHSHTLYNLNHLKKVAKDNEVLTYSSFLKLIAKVDAPSEPENPIEKSFKKLDIEFEQYSLPDMDSFKPGISSLNPLYPGGHSEGLRRMNEKIKDKSWVSDFSKPKTNPCSLLPSTTVLSPYLKFGCLSIRLFYIKIKEIYKTRHHSSPPESLEGQILWREFFYYVAAFTPNFDRMKGNKYCRQIDWDYNEKYLNAWEQGKTGFPFIDAIMIQLRLEGWIHHLARHAVACFLTRGDLYCSWEYGMGVFEELLLDADWSLNAANWQWLSASRFFNQYWRVYSPISFGKNYDKNGDYIRKYIPVLKKLPAKFIYEPWKAPKEVLKNSGIVLGKDYPLPIVDHAEVSKINISRLKNHHIN